ncbi:MAG: phenol hydroxylase subunit P4 [Magnetospirillum sp.]|nr:phenol hydroxylase subunit P4 [Magnetospirillum sp.]
MAIVALEKDYAEKIDVRDRQDNFHGNIVSYVHWEEHLSFCAALAFPLPPAMPFQALVSDVIGTYYRAHPDFARIDWSQVTWTIDGKPVQPDMAKSLAENGVGHKSLIRFWTPGLDGYCHSRS